MVHTHYHLDGKTYQIDGSSFIAEPYKASNGDIFTSGRFNVNGMILTNKSLVHFYPSGSYYNEWNYPLLRYFPSFFQWFNKD